MAVAKELIVILPMPCRVEWRIIHENAALQHVNTAWTGAERNRPNSDFVGGQESGFADGQHVAWNLDLTLGNWRHVPKHDRPL